MSSYFGQFKRFNPLFGEVPSAHFSLLPSIASRARLLLQTRTSEEIEATAKVIDFAIFCHFDEIKQNEISRLRHELEAPRRWKRERAGADDAYDFALQFFDWDGGSVENGRWMFNEGMEDKLEIPTQFNTGEIEALKDLEGWWEELATEELPNGKPHELFAVLALWLLADAIHWLEKDCSGIAAVESLDQIMNGLLNSKTESASKYVVNNSRFSLAGERALFAMEAVCFGEHLKAIEGVHVAHFQREMARQDEDQKKKSIRAQELNKARHQARNEAMQKVVEEWEKTPSAWQSAEKAGLHFSNWLLKDGIEYEPRTVTGWIRDHAKRLGVKFR